MGREVRRVPSNWQHPQDEDGEYIPLFGDSFAECAARWDEEDIKWREGFVEDWDWKPGSLIERWRLRGPACSMENFADWDGPRPVESDYMPDWPMAERTHWQMYETTTEGTPISPIFATAEDLARWLADTGASAFGSYIATYEEWLATIMRGSAVSAIMTTYSDGSRELESGVVAEARLRDV